MLLEDEFKRIYLASRAGNLSQAIRELLKVVQRQADEINGLKAELNEQRITSYIT